MGADPNETEQVFYYDDYKLGDANCSYEDVAPGGGSSSGGGSTTNNPPSVSFLTPSDGATFTAPADVSIEAIASDNDGSISKVDLWSNGSFVRTETASPYTWDLTGLSAGTYTLEARAYDNDGATTNATISISVTDGSGGGSTTNTPPSVSFLTPSDGATFTAPADVSIEAIASDNDGSISKVDLWSNGSFVRTETASPYTWDLTGLSAGTYTLEARAYDNDGATTNATISISVTDGSGGGSTTNTPPSVSFLTPSDGATFTAPADVTVDATASDADGSVSKVELRNNGSLIGSETSSPYTWNLTVLSAGTYTLEARAYDNDGATTNASISITVNDDGSTGGTVTNVAINTAGPSYTGNDGISYLADTYFSGGNTYSSGNSIDGTTDDVLYESERYAKSFSYDIPVDSGDYTVTLKFAEVYFTSSGKRVFDVALEGTQVISNLDIYAKVGQNAAYDETHTVNVSDGNLDIDFSADVDNAKIAAIVVSSSDGGTTTNSAPSVSITSPSDGATFTAPADVTVEATASDADGSVSKVELRNNGSLIGSETSSPYTWNLTGLSAGTYTLEARAYDNDGATTNASITISVTDGSGGTTDPQTLTFTPVDDAYIEGSKTKNDGYLKVEPDYRVSYLKFDVQGLSSSVSSAILTLRVDGDPGDGTIRLYEGSHNNWTESTLSTSNDPSAGTEYASRTGSWTEGQDYSFDLSSLITGDGTYTIVMKMDAGGNDAWFSSSEGSKSPELVVTTTGSLSKRNPEMVLPKRSAVDLATVRIFDMSGRQVFIGTTRDTRNITTEAIGFNERGVYLLRIDSKFGLKNRKIVIR